MSACRSTDGTSLPVVVRRLDEEGIAVTELALRLPSLDEVFLALTGHAAEETERRHCPGRSGSMSTA